MARPGVTRLHGNRAATILVRALRRRIPNAFTIVCMRAFKSNSSVLMVPLGSWSARDCEVAILKASACSVQPIRLGAALW